MNTDIEGAIRTAVLAAIESIGGYKELHKLSWFPSSREVWGGTRFEGWGGD